jgi:hypothetical protein
MFLNNMNMHITMGSALRTNNSNGHSPQILKNKNTKIRFRRALVNILHVTDN